MTACMHVGEQLGENVHITKDVGKARCMLSELTACLVASVTSNSGPEYYTDELSLAMQLTELDGACKGQVS